VAVSGEWRLERACARAHRRVAGGACARALTRGSARARLRADARAVVHGWRAHLDTTALSRSSTRVAMGCVLPGMDSSMEKVTGLLFVAQSVHERATLSNLLQE